MSNRENNRMAAATPAHDPIAERLAGGFIHPLTPMLGMPARVVCPSGEAEQALVDAMTRAAAVQGIPVEVIDLRSEPAERLGAVTARLDGWESGAAASGDGPVQALLILLGFDVFGNDAQDAPTYPFRSKFQFDRKYLWLFVGRDASRMRFLFDSHRRPLYHAAGDITPDDWKRS
jgi:hypothetical protein